MDNKKLKTKLVDLENSSGFSEVLTLVKREKCYEEGGNSHLFWQSSLPVKWFNEFLSEPFFEEFIFGYFSSENNCNSDFLKLLVESKNKSVVIKIIKLSKAFEKQKHWDSFKIFFKDTKLKQLYRELLYIKKYQAYWENEAKKYTRFIQELDYEDILIQIISYYEKFKRYSSKTLNNRKVQVSYEHHLISVLNTILNIKKGFILENKLDVTNKYDTKHFRLVVKEELPPIRPIESHQNPALIPKENISELKKKIREIVEFLFQKEVNEYQIQKYLTGYANFQIIDGLESELITNEKYSFYRKTLEKGNYDETYLSNRVLGDNQFLNKIQKYNFWEREFEWKRESSLEYFRFLKIPSVINSKYSELDIDLEKVLLLVQTFSALLIPQGRTIINLKSYKRKIPQKFEKLFYSNYIVSYSQEELISKCEEYFEWSSDEIKTIIEYLTTDLSSNRKFQIDILKRPIIKIGKQYIWLSSFLRDRRWEVNLHRRIVFDKSKSLFSQSIESEKYISKLFKEAKFGSVSSHHYEYNNKKGEIDILAFKEDTLFVFELKSTYVEEDIMKTSVYETLIFK